MASPMAATTVRHEFEIQWPKQERVAARYLDAGNAQEVKSKFQKVKCRNEGREQGKGLESWFFCSCCAAAARDS